MYQLRLSRIAAMFVAALILCPASAALAATADMNATSQQNAMVKHDPQPFASFVPGATEKWCDSLPYPYCEVPNPDAPDAGPAPYVVLMPDHPIFGR